MSFVLLVIAGIVIYYLYITFEEYLKNPHTAPQKVQERQEYTQKDNPYALPTPKDKLKNSYGGASIGMINALMQANTTTPSLLQLTLIDSFIKNLHLQESQENLLKQMLPSLDFSVLQSKQSSVDSNPSQATQNTQANNQTTPISKLAQIFLDNTYGEYKKRLHFVGFTLMLAWSDKTLDEKEQDIILDIAAFLQLENAEFNELYDSFESLFNSKAKSSDKSNQTISNNVDSQINSSDFSELIAKYTKDLQTEQEQSNSTLQLAYQTLIQKQYSKSQKIARPQAELLKQLLALESAYNAKNA